MFTMSAKLFTVLLALCFFLQLVVAAPTAATSDTALRRRGPRRCTAKPKPKPKTAVNNADPPPGDDDPTPDPEPEPTPPPPPTINGCFPALGFDTPSLSGGKPNVPLNQWWCDREDEYAFLGFSYAVDSCPSADAMTRDFKRMRSIGSRYVRMYGACDRRGFNDDVVRAGYEAGVGIFSLVWFGFDGGSAYKGRLDAILNTVRNNPLAPYVIRNIVIGSEAMFDHAIDAGGLVNLINNVKGQVHKYGIQVSTSDMAGQFRSNPNVLRAVDHAESNTLPFFSGDATQGGSSNAWNSIQRDIDFFADASDHKIYLAQTGWPSNTAVWKPNSRSAVASVGSEEAYWRMIDSKCSVFKKGPKGGVGYFFHVWSDNGLPGWGYLNQGGSPKFNYKPKTHC